MLAVTLVALIAAVALEWYLEKIAAARRTSCGGRATALSLAARFLRFGLAFCLIWGVLLTLLNAASLVYYDGEIRYR